MSIIFYVSSGRKALLEKAAKMFISRCFYTGEVYKSESSGFNFLVEATVEDYYVLQSICAKCKVRLEVQHRNRETLASFLALTASVRHQSVLTGIRRRYSVGFQRIFKANIEDYWDGKFGGLDLHRFDQ